MSRRSFIGAAVAAIASLGMSLVGITATATPAAAGPSCHAQPFTPAWGTPGTTVKGDGFTSCSATMKAIRVELELVVRKNGVWTPIGEASKVATDEDYVYEQVIGPCKGSGRSDFATKARGTALWMPDGYPGGYTIKEPADGSSYRWSYTNSLHCGDPPPPPTKDDVCRTFSRQASAPDMTMRSSSTKDGGVIPVC